MKVLKFVSGLSSIYSSRSLPVSTHYRAPCSSNFPLQDTRSLAPKLWLHRLSSSQKMGSSSMGSSRVKQHEEDKTYYGPTDRSLGTRKVCRPHHGKVPAEPKEATKGFNPRIFNRWQVCLCFRFFLIPETSAGTKGGFTASGT